MNATPALNVTDDARNNAEQPDSRNGVKAEVDNCPNCGKYELLAHLHGDRGGPLICIRCGMDWYGKHGRRRNAGRIVIKAIRAYYEAGGDSGDIDKLKVASFGRCGLDSRMIQLGYESDNTGAALPDLTSELLKDVLQLVHPDHQPQERRELATRVTRELNLLKPFVFPAPKPEPAPPSKADTRDGSLKSQGETFNKPSQCYPCEDCADHAPYYYCTACRAEWDKRQKAKKERKSAKQREQYKRRKLRRQMWKRPEMCAVCGKNFDKRADANCCSDRCKQKLYRQRKAGMLEKTPSPKQIARRQERERKARIHLKWKKLSSLPDGSIVVVNADRNGRFPRGTKLKKDGWFGWGFWLEEANEKKHIFDRRALEWWDIVPDGIEAP